MSTIQNLQSFDPFADATKGDDLLPAGTEDYIHIRIQQRNGRKTLTTVQGIADDYDKKKLVKAFKKVKVLGRRDENVVIEAHL
uniref:Eukaryotic translation initiation factor 1B n=1 Tax=Capra hircus TaxID=9925 RepID=A0A452FNH6_CAPHI